MQNTVLNVHPTTSASTTITTSDLQQQLYFKMKSNLQAQVDEPELNDAFRKRDHDDHQGDDAPPKGEKSAKRQKGIRRQKAQSLNTEEKRYVLLLHQIHTVSFPEEDLEEKMNRWVKREFKTFNEEAWLSIQH
ncbi:hypothetical protein Tco_1576419 [Tanacetum coccineum]